MIPQRVSLVTLGVADLDRARAFYESLGWRATDGAPGVSFYQLQNSVLGLFGLADLAADQGRPGAALGTGAATLAQNFATAAEVDAAFAAALAAGATALKPPEAVFWGGYSGYWADPDGHVWEVAMNPFWPLGPAGELTLPGAVETVTEDALTPAVDAAIAALLARSFAPDFGGRSFFTTRHHWRHLIRAEGAVVAHLAVQLRALRLGGRLTTVAALAEVATDPAHRGRGHAATLVRAAIDRARGGVAEHVILFGTAGLYAAAGFRAVGNPMTYVDMIGPATGTIRRERAQTLMVLPLRGTAWDDAAALDLIGGLI